jgi:nitrogen regulatory protein PII
MKMLLLVFRSSLEEDMLHLLNSLGVKAFTEASKVFGKGETGTAFGSFSWPGSNSLILAALEDDQTDKVVKGLKAFRDRLAGEQHGEKIPIRVFILPCKHVI